uniref:Uncharacterized protein n=1 Tax=Caenorhabditis tropicalis TaxID=1561998 RepID=A0A1I7TEA7_9PELO
MCRGLRDCIDYLRPSSALKRIVVYVNPSRISMELEGYTNNRWAYIQYNDGRCGRTIRKKTQKFKNLDFIEKFCNDFDAILRSHVPLPLVYIRLVLYKPPPPPPSTVLEMIFGSAEDEKPEYDEEKICDGVIIKILARLALKQPYQIKKIQVDRKKFLPDFLNLCEDGYCE